MNGKRVSIVALTVVAMWLSCLGLFAQAQEEGPKVVAYFTRGDFTEVLVRPQYPADQVVIVEPKGQFAEIDVDETNAIMRKLLNSDRFGARRTIKQITSNHGRYAPTALYLASSAMFDLGDKDAATFWFYVAQVRARSDAMKMRHPMAGQAVAALNEMFGQQINEHAFRDWQELKAMVKRVVDWDRRQARSYDPRWIALHGMTAYSDGKVPIEPETKWSEINEECRTGWLSEFHQAMKTMEEADLDGDGQLNDSERTALQQKMMELAILERYEKTQETVEFDGRPLEGVHARTFQTLDDPIFAKDKSNVYFAGHLIRSADASTFAVIGGPYSKDKSNVFCGNLKVEVANRDAFELVEWDGGWTQTQDEKDLIFEFGKSIVQWEVSASRPAVYGTAWACDGVFYYYGPARVEGADYESFEVLPGGFEAKDKNHTYLGAFPEEDWPLRRREILGRG